MAYNYQQAAPFWDFVRSMQNTGAGVDQPSQGFNMWGPPPPPPPPGHGPHAPDGPGFPFGGAGPFGFGPGPGPRGGRRGGHHGSRRDGSHDRSAQREQSGEDEQTGGEGRERSPRREPRHRGRHGHGRRGGEMSGEEGSDGEGREGFPGPHRGPRHHGRHGPCGMRGRGGWGGARGGWGGPNGHHNHQSPFWGPGGPFDFSALVESLSAHPLAQAARDYAQRNAYGSAPTQRAGETLIPEDADMENSFVPPIDVFTTENAFVLHVALPGAKKEDVGVHWDAEKGVLNMAGVVYRKGDEKFLESLTRKERKVGAFERTMKLPINAEDKDEIDGDNITAKLEDGVLVITVPKIEKEESWTEIKRVGIE